MHPAVTPGAEAYGSGDHQVVMGDSCVMLSSLQLARLSTGCIDLIDGRRQDPCERDKVPILVGDNVALECRSCGRLCKGQPTSAEVLQHSRHVVASSQCIHVVRVMD